MIVGILIVVAYFVINAIIASFMKNAAVLKGYGDDCHAWILCFLCGIVGCLYVVALPDKIQQSQNQQMIELLKEMRNEND